MKSQRFWLLSAVLGGLLGGVGVGPAVGQLLPAAPPAPALWHNQPRTLRYHPDGSDFVITNGTHRFTRALYGTNTAFRVEAGDLPEFALYLPGMGGNLKFGLLANGQSKWLIKAENITARYRPGLMLYDITDPLLGAGMLHLEVLALADAEGVVVKAQFENVPAGKVQLLWAFGGATGRKFSRDGDIGADPESSFYLKPEYCQGNALALRKNTFTLTYGLNDKPPKVAPTTPPAPKVLAGTMPLSAKLHIADAAQQESPAQLLASSASATPVLVGTVAARAGEALYFSVQKPAAPAAPVAYAALPAAFRRAEAARQQLAGRVQVSTPDPYINTLGGALAVAADAIWETPSYLHGAIAWRIRLNGWRGAYAADPLGWHDRASTHFAAYAQSQLTSPASGPVTPDTALHHARQLEQLGTAVFSSGYISRNPGEFRPHHYDMNLVYVDALLRHLRWTGDLAEARQLWPTLQRHLAWEKRNFDPDNDGLYDAYAAIWASDALQYSGGAVTHTSAYNYLANKLAAELAGLIGENAAPYQQEAAHIHQSLQSRLWLPAQGWYAEYQDALGLKALHPAAALWTVYHALDSEVPDAFQAYQALRYVDAELPHIPVRAAGLPDAGYHLLSTTSWQPYDWSINNVVLAENLHASLAQWQAGRAEDAFLLWKSALLESMYLGSSPGNFQQVSFYDTYRGELYRDFADPIGVAARSLVEGLFGIRPDALHGTLRVQPGLPAAWDSASLTVPDISFVFRRQGQREVYTLVPRFAKSLKLQLQIAARATGVQSVTVNGQPATWKNLPEAVGRPVLEISSAPAAQYVVEIQWQDAAPVAVAAAVHLGPGERLAVDFAPATIVKFFDPQQVVTGEQLNGSRLEAQTRGQAGSRTLFVQLRQGALTWWQPLRVQLAPRPVPTMPSATVAKWETVPLEAFFNDQVTQIFQQQYLSPRLPTATLALPTQGIGNWCYPLIQANIDDAGLRRAAGAKNEIALPTGVPLRTPGAAGAKNILFVSQWDNYPRQITLPLRGRASRAVLLMAGSTNPMQSQFVNGEVTATYTDGTTATLPLRNPNNWWPIEQDYLDDGFAFQTGAPKPYRLYLKTGLVTRDFNQFIPIKGYSTRAIDGGAATVLELPLNPAKKLKSLTVKALANDVVIGLMSVTLGR